MPEKNNREKAIERAKEWIWRILRRDLELKREDEAVLYLEHFLNAKFESIEAQENGFKRVRFKMYQRISDYSSSYNANSGEQMSWYFDVLEEGMEKKAQEDKCLNVAQQAANLSQGAVLEVAQYEEQGGEKVFIARWRHEANGIPVERDYIQVLVNGKTLKPFSFSQKWHRIKETPGER